MDSWEWNKIAGAILGTLIFIMVIRIAGEAIFSVSPPAKPGFVIVAAAVSTQAAAAPAPVEEALPDWGTVLPTADVSKGQQISHKCEQCHNLAKGGPNLIGPNLWNIVDSPRGVDRGGFDFSAAMKAKGGSWTLDELFKFLRLPGAYIPGTKMTFAGLRSAADRIALIAYLRTLSDSPAPIPPAAPAKTPAATPPKAAPKK